MKTALYKVLSLSAAAVLVVGLGLLAGCLSRSGSTKTSTLPRSYALTGVVDGGQQPVAGATVTLYAAGVGTGVEATTLGTATTDSNGKFKLGYACSSASAPIYMTATGGNPGLGTGINNTAIYLMAALDTCGNPPSFVHINEVTTVTAGYALNGFIGAGRSQQVNVHGTNPGLANAMKTAALLADVTSGLASPPLPLASTCMGKSPLVNCGVEERLDSLANVLAACVNTAGGDSPPCMELFACAVPMAIYGNGRCTLPTGAATPGDTLEAILDIARNPGQVPISGIYDLAIQHAVFSPALTATPTDWTLALAHSGCGRNGSTGIAVDASGNVWVTNPNNNSVCEFDSSGKLISPNRGYIGGGLDRPYGIAVDTSGHVWVTNSKLNGKSISEFDGKGNAMTSSSFTGGGLEYPVDVAADVGGHIWVTNIGTSRKTNHSLSEFDSSGKPLSPSSGYTGGGLDAPVGIAVDASGHVWVANLGKSSLSEFDNSGKPLSPSSGYTGGGLNNPMDIAVDASGDVWVANLPPYLSYEHVNGHLRVVRYNHSISEFGSNGKPLSPSSGYTGGGLDGPAGIAVDASGHVWVADSENNAGIAYSISEFNSRGNPLSPSSGYTGGGLIEPQGIAVDASGNVWVTNFIGYSLIEFIGAASPTRTPLVLAHTQGFTP